MIELLEYITQSITGSKDIKVEKDASGDLTIYTIKAPKSVMGLLIGKAGRTIQAIRTLAKARAITDQERIALRIEEQAE